jgi:hypothetical protein
MFNSIKLTYLVFHVTHFFDRSFLSEPECDSRRLTSNGANLGFLNSFNHPLPQAVLTISDNAKIFLLFDVRDRPKKTIHMERVHRRQFGELFDRGPGKISPSNFYHCPRSNLSPREFPRMGSVQTCVFGLSAFIAPDRSQIYSLPRSSTPCRNSGTDDHRGRRSHGARWPTDR